MSVGRRRKKGIPLSRADVPACTRTSWEKFIMDHRRVCSSPHPRENDASATRANQAVIAAAPEIVCLRRIRTKCVSRREGYTGSSSRHRLPRGAWAVPPLEPSCVAASRANSPLPQKKRGNKRQRRRMSCHGLKEFIGSKSEGLRGEPLWGSSTELRQR